MDNRERKEIRKGYFRANFHSTWARFNLTIPIRTVLCFRGKAVKIKDRPYILMMNHVDNFDPGYESLLIRETVRHVISDHLVRTPLARAIVYIYSAPIVN